MTRAATFLIIMTLTGTPLAKVGCAALCYPPYIVGSAGGCHDDAASSTHAVLVSFHSCDTVLSTPFVVEGTRQAAPAAAHGLAAFSIDVVASGRVHVTRRDSHSPPRSHSVSAVLRI